MKPKMETPLNVKLTKDQRAMLAQLAEDANVKMSDIVRQAISDRFQQRYANVPKCVTGTPCMCPQMHILQNQPQNTDSELLAQVQSGKVD